jgi:hypothetical protein
MLPSVKKSMCLLITNYIRSLNVTTPVKLVWEVTLITVSLAGLMIPRASCSIQQTALTHLGAKHAKRLAIQDILQMVI